MNGKVVLERSGVVGIDELHAGDYAVIVVAPVNDEIGLLVRIMYNSDIKYVIPLSGDRKYTWKVQNLNTGYRFRKLAKGESFKVVLEG